MFKNLILLSIFTSSISASVIELPSKVYGGNLFHNEKPIGICYIQINEVTENEAKGKYCHDLNVQFMFGLDDQGIHSRDMELILQSRRTNLDTEFKKPGTCAEVTAEVERPWEIDRWGDDDTHLFNQVFANEYKVNGKKNHYILNFSGKTKTPSRAMIHRIGILREDSYECRNLTAM